MSGLKRIILIDTHLPGLVELTVDGHTNICGTNASGKTTLQRLVPVFFGESPNKVVPATRDNFQTWYLPRESSFIIFEYQRLDGQMCMAVLTSSSSGVVYRFVEKGFVKTDFIAEDLNGSRSILIQEIMRNMRRAQVVVSKALNTKEYRAIIQNDRPVLALSSHKRELLSFARLFSICEQHARLRHIEKLIKAVHSKEGKMETIKAMIAAILEEDGVATPSNKLSKKQVEDWIKECLLIKEFKQLMPQYEVLQKVNGQLTQTENRLSQLKTLIATDLLELAESIDKADSDLKVYKDQLSNKTRDFEQLRDELNRDVSAFKGEVDNAEQHLEHIENEFAIWQDKDIETHKENLDKLDGYKSQLGSLSEQHKLLTEEHQDIEAAYNKRVADIEKKKSKELEQLNKHKDDVGLKLRNTLQEEQKSLRKLQVDQDQRRLQINQDFDRQINQQSMQLERVKTEIELSGPLPQEQQAMAVIEASLEQAQQEEDGVRFDLSKLQKDLQQAKYEQMGANELLNKTRSKTQACQQRVDAVHALMYPGDNTLLDFLRKEHPTWQKALGKVINPELLTRTDLAPSMLNAQLGDTDPQALESLYGVLLDTEVINDSDILQSQTQLNQQFDVANQDLTAAQNTQQDAEAALVGCTDKVKQLEVQFADVNSQCTFKQEKRQRIQDERGQLKQEHKQALAQRKKNQSGALDGLKAALNKLQLNKQDALEGDDEQRHQEKMDHEMHWQQVVGDVEQQLTSLEQQISDANAQHKQAMKDCKAWYKNELASREVDVDQIARLKHEISELKELIDTTNQFRDEVKDYSRWYELVFTQQKAKYLAQLSKANEQKSRSERLLSEKTSLFKNDKRQLQKQIQSLDAALKRQHELANGLNALKGKFATLTLPRVEVMNEQSSMAGRLTEARELLEKQRKYVDDIAGHVNHFDNLIGQKSGISLTEAWEHARRDCFTVNEQGIETLNHRKMLNELDTLLTVMVPQHEQGVRNNGLNFGKDISQYYKILLDIDKRIVTQSKRISKQVDQELFLDGVSDSSVKIRSKISEFDFWPKLIRFNQLYQDWYQNEQAILPDEEYTQTMREVQEVLGRATMTGGIAQLLDIELHLKEGNSDLFIRTDRQLNESSSHGMAYLILCKFLLAFTRLLRGDSQVVVHWPIDEIGTLANKNVKKIFDACHANNIWVVGAFPNPESDVLQFFENRYLIDKDAKKQKLRKVLPKINPISERLKQRQASEMHTPKQEQESQL